MSNNLKATELRIGNYLFCDGEISEINGVTQFSIHWGRTNFAPISNQIGIFKPIPLTEEWLEMFGFERDKPKQHNGLMIFNSNGLYLHIYTGTEKGCLISLSDASAFQFLKPLGGNIQFVHQLQNLYHSLTGEELTIKESENGK